MPRERNQFGRLHTGIESTFSTDGREIEESITTLQRGRSERFHWGLIFRRWVKIKLLPDEEASIGHDFSKNTRNSAMHKELKENDCICRSLALMLKYTGSSIELLHHAAVWTWRNSLIAAYRRKYMPKYLPKS
jgi:hypothetical protein